MKAKALFLAVGALLAVGATRSDAVHFALTRSVPAADASVASPAEVRLWFTEPAKDGSMGVRLVNAAGALVETTEVAADPQDAKVYFITVGRALAAGRYTVAWRGVGADGHALNGEFGFTVSAE